MKRQNPRGFVMILVLLVVVALTAAVLGQLAVVQSQQLAARRDDDQVHARAVAEHCLARGRLYLNQLRDETTPEDFDAVLDPNLNSHPVAAGFGGADDFSDDFVPGNTYGGVVTYIPPEEASQSGLRQAKHRFRYLPMDGGGCFVRFDDNGDDSRSAGGSDVAGIEGTGLDIPYRDRDMGIQVTAIGVFPVGGSTAAVDAYAKAKARVSLRTFVSTGGAPGVVARDDLVVQSNVAICGQGGFQGDNLTYNGGGSSTTVCACGDTATVSGATLPSQCNYASGPGNPCDDNIPCQPGASASLPIHPSPDVKVPKPVDWLALDGMQDPRNPQPLGNNGVCEFYFRAKNVDFTWDLNPLDNLKANDLSPMFTSNTSETGEVFLWDHTDDDAQGCSDATPRSLALCATAKLVTHNCKTGAGTTYVVDGKDVVKRPCKWVNPTGNDSAGQGPNVQCADPATQTPCWKLIARITSDNNTTGAVALGAPINTLPTVSSGTPSASAALAIVQQDFVAATDIKPVGTACPTTACTGGDVCYRGNVCVNATLRDFREDTKQKAAFSESISPYNNPKEDSAAENLLLNKGNQRPPNIARFWGDPAGVPNQNVVDAPLQSCDGDSVCEPGESTTSCADCTGASCNNNDVCAGGEGPGCNDCVVPWWDQTCGACPDCRTDDGWGLKGDEHWHFEKLPMCQEQFFSPAILIFENQALSLTNSSKTGSGRFHVKEDWGFGCPGEKPARATIISQGQADIDQNTRLCGAFSDCTGFPTAATPNSLCTAASRSKANGYAVRAGGSCFFGLGAVFVGDMQCGNIHIDQTPTNSCSAGDLIAFNDTVASPMGDMCPTSAAFGGFVSACDNGICTNASFGLAGDMISAGDICIKNGALVFGSVLGGGDGDKDADDSNNGNVYIESGVTINGQLVSEGDIGIKTNTVINNNGIGVFGTRVTGGIISESAY